MISYDSGRYGVSLIFSLEGSVFPRALVIAVPCSILSMALHIILHSNPGFLKNHWPGETAATLLGGFTTILGFLVVFRTQQAYNRWFEGGALLLEIRGEWFNAFTSCLAFCNQSSEKRRDVKAFQHQLARMVSMLYNCALQQLTTMGSPDFEILPLDGFDSSSMSFLHRSHDRVEIAFQWLQKLIVEADNAGIIDTSPPLLSRVYNQLSNGMVKVNSARKISEFPIPYPYAQMLTVMLIFHSLFTSVMCAVVLTQWYWTVLVVFIVVASFWSINYIAVEVEMPFGDDANDLPLQGIMREMNESLIELLSDGAQTVPHFSYKPEEYAPEQVSVYSGPDPTFSPISSHSIQKFENPMIATRTNNSNSNVSDGPNTFSAAMQKVTLTPLLHQRSCLSLGTVSSRFSGQSRAVKMCRQNLVSKDKLPRYGGTSETSACQNGADTKARRNVNARPPPTCQTFEIAQPAIKLDQVSAPVLGIETGDNVSVPSTSDEKFFAVQVITGVQEKFSSSHPHELGAFRPDSMCIKARRKSAHNESAAQATPSDKPIVKRSQTLWL